MNLTRREALSKGSLAVGGAIALAGCAATTVNGVTTYGLDPTVVTFIQDAVSAVSKYVPAIESIAATAAALFGPAYTALVTAGSAAVNTVISDLENLVPSLPVGKAKMYAKYRAMATPSMGGTFIGYTKQGVPVFAQ